MKSVVPLNHVAWILATEPTAESRAPELAVLLSREATHRAPRHLLHRIWNTYGVALYHTGETQEAIRALLTSIAVSGVHHVDAFNFFYLALAYHRLGDTPSAGKYLRMGDQWMKDHEPFWQELRPLKHHCESIFQASRWVSLGSRAR